MELEWTGWDSSKNGWRVWVVGMLLGLLLLFGWIGRPVTVAGPDGLPVLISWSGWRLLRAEADFTAERNALRQELEHLTALLDRPAEPVLAQITADRLARSYQDGQPALAHQRRLLIEAAQAVLDHAVGALDLAGAQRAVRLAGQALELPDGAASDFIQR